MAQIIKTHMWWFKFITFLFAHQAPTLANYQRRGFPPALAGLSETTWLEASRGQLVHEPWAGWYVHEREDQPAGRTTNTLHG